jgi:predicted transcriptional regulator
MSFVRTVVDIPIEIIESLDKISIAEKCSRAALIREAIAAYLRQKLVPSAEAAFGLWQHRQTDGVQYQRSVRDPWESQ